MTWNLITFVSVIVAGTAVFIGMVSRPSEVPETPYGKPTRRVSAFSESVSRELVFYGGLTGEVVVGRTRATPLPLINAGGGEYLVEVPGAERPVYLSEPYAVVYFEPVEMSAAHALIMTDSSFSLSAGEGSYERVLPRPIYPDGGWDAMFYKGAVAFEPVPPGADRTVTLDAPYSVDPGRPTAVVLSKAVVEFPFSAFYPPGTFKTGQVMSRPE
jgi:hypothetical protein